LFLWLYKKCGLLFENYIGLFGLRLPCTPIYAESPHSRVNIRYITEVHYNVSKIE